MYQYARVRVERSNRTSSCHNKHKRNRFGQLRYNLSQLVTAWENRVLPKIVFPIWFPTTCTDRHSDVGADEAVLFSNANDLGGCICLLHGCTELIEKLNQISPV